MPAIPRFENSRSSLSFQYNAVIKLELGSQSIRASLSTSAEHFRTPPQQLECIMSTSQDDLWCPVDAGTEVRIETVLCQKSIDMCFQKDTGSRLLSQYENIKNTNQMWKLERVGSMGYLIRHVDSGLCLIPTTVGKDGRVYTDVGPFGHAFTFERHRDSSVIIHLAEKKEYTLTVEGSSEKTGARYVLWPHGGGAASKWYIKDFYDLN